MKKHEYSYWCPNQRKEYSCLDCLKFQKTCKGYMEDVDLNTCAFFSLSGDTDREDEYTLGTDRFAKDVIINLIIGDIGQ